ncbi:MAG: PHP domain-containing protein, partial [Desulfobaccales bacterium]
MELIDLHVHSTASDGTFAPAEVVLLAREGGLKALALTDHDTIDGLAEAVAAGA